MLKNTSRYQSSQDYINMQYYVIYQRVSGFQSTPDQVSTTYASVLQAVIYINGFEISEQFYHHRKCPDVVIYTKVIT